MTMPLHPMIYLQVDLRLKGESAVTHFAWRAPNLEECIQLARERRLDTLISNNKIFSFLAQVRINGIIIAESTDQYMRKWKQLTTLEDLADGLAEGRILGF